MLLPQCSGAHTQQGQAETQSQQTEQTETTNNNTPSTTQKVRVGLEELVSANWKPLEGKRVGLIVNQTSRTSASQFGPQLFARAKEFTLAALYTPEHGLFGQREAGKESDSAFTYEGVPVYSLYGSARKPTKKMLAGINALVFDIQDIGVRPYTYLSTMVLAMEAAAENGIPFYVLDRPNPLGGERVEGNILELQYKSFVGQVPVPYIHGMTLGELAKMAKGEKWFNSADKLDLTVIPLKNWKRNLTWNQTGLPWTAPSPNIPKPENAVGAAMLGAIGELGLLSIGVNTDKAFLRIGSSLVKGPTMERIVRDIFPKEITVIRDNYTAPVANAPKYFEGIQLVLPSDWNTIPTLLPHQFRLMEAVLKDTDARKAFDAVPQSSKQMFTKVMGNAEILPTMDQCKDLSPLEAKWLKEVESFKARRAKYLLYQ